MSSFREFMKASFLLAHRVIQSTVCGPYGLLIYELPVH